MTRNLGPGPAHRSETTSAATPVAGRPGRHFGASGYVRPLAGLGTVVALVAIIALAVSLFRGSWSETIPVTVISDRAGLVMNPDARVKMRGVQVGKVSSIESKPDGTAAIHLAVDKSQLHLIPSNVNVDIASSTVFGAKFVQFQAPAEPSPDKLREGQVIQGQHVMVEINTVFQQLVQVLDKLDPVKLNQTLGAIATAFNGRGEKIGQTLTDFNAFLAKIEPSLPNLSHDIEAAVPTLNAYADAAPDLIATVRSTTQLSRTIVDQQQQLDEFLVSSIGLADIGNDVVGGNRQALTDVLRPACADNRSAQPVSRGAWVQHRRPRLFSASGPRFSCRVLWCRPVSHSASSDIAIRRICRRSLPRAAHTAKNLACPRFPPSFGRRSSSLMSAPTPTGTETRAFC